MKNSLIDNKGFSLPNEKKTKLESQIAELKTQEQQIIKQLRLWESKLKKAHNLANCLAAAEKFGKQYTAEMVEKEKNQAQPDNWAWEYLIKEQTEFTLKFEAGSEAFTQLILQKIVGQVSYLQNKLIERRLLLMGAEILKFDGFLDNTNYLKEFRCPNCQQFLSQQDIQHKNYQLWVSDYANDISKSEFLADRLNRNLTCYSLTFWLKSVEHEYCPQTEICQNCYQRLLTSIMKELNDNYYCADCVKEVKLE